MKRSVAMERHFSADVLADILQRLPTSSRRRARLVCRHWRDVVDDRTTEMQSRLKPLLWDNRSSVAYVVDHLSSSAWRCRELWRSGASDSESPNVQLVGTCNGLLLLCDDGQVGGALTVVNPVTWETLPVPPLPCPRRFARCRRRKNWHEAYGFAYLPTSGKYKVVHVPCKLDSDCEFGAMQVLTLGDANWREMPFRAPKCDLAAGIVTVDGTTYWVTASATGKLVAFNLDKERVPSTNSPLPNRGWCHITEMHGRLGFVVKMYNRTDVWVLEEGRRWTHWYNFGQHVPQPHFAFAGLCVLTVCDRSSFYVHQWKRMPFSSGSRLRCDDVVRVVREDKGTPVINIMPGGYFNTEYRVFAYVETTEPLNVYA